MYKNTDDVNYEVNERVTVDGDGGDDGGGGGDGAGKRVVARGGEGGGGRGRAYIYDARIAFSERAITRISRFHLDAGYWCGEKGVEIARRWCPWPNVPIESLVS